MFCRSAHPRSSANLNASAVALEEIRVIWEPGAAICSHICHCSLGEWYKKKRLSISIVGKFVISFWSFGQNKALNWTLPLFKIPKNCQCILRNAFVPTRKLKYVWKKKRKLKTAAVMATTSMEDGFLQDFPVCFCRFLKKDRLMGT